MRLKQCPKCKHNAKRVSSKEHHGNYEYGVLCSNERCSWSYGWTMFNTRDAADKAWNLKVEHELFLQRESRKLKPCECGKQPRLIHECYYPVCDFWFVRCDECNLTTTAQISMDTVIEKWNEARTNQ